MNELDDTLMQLFAESEPAAADEAFAAAVRRRVVLQRRLATAAKLALVATIAVAAGALVAFVPEAVLYPANLLLRLIGPELAVAVSLLGAVALTWWSRVGDA